ncbi:MAG TPA: hypothetical protein VGA00_08550 [Acidiferrobacterales bacterium]|jgi:hypothetical protein
MKTDEVPQEDSMLGEHRRACYALDEQGRYVVVPSKGWSVESIVNAQANAEVDRAIMAAHARVAAGAASPLAYHMARRQMTPALLAANAGIWVLRVRWHLRPKAFARLPDEVLNRYAEALGTDVATLKHLPPVPGR